jgi:hypothetical protein
LRNVSPEQRAQLAEQLRQAAASYAGLTAEQKQQMLAMMSEYINAAKRLTPAQRTRLRALYRRLLNP